MANQITDANNFFDVNGLNDIKLQAKSSGKADKHKALVSAAKQFESIFMQMLLKSMRSAEDVLAPDTPFNSQTSKFYRDMHDKQLALELSKNGSLGLAPLIIRQLGGDSEHFTPSSVLKAHPLSLTNNADKAIKAESISLHQSKQFNPIQPTQIPLKAERSITNIQPQFNAPKDFVSALVAPAKKVQQALGIPFDVVIAQAALETGWGKKIVKKESGESSNNLFNIKADGDWQGESARKDTLEFEQGAMVKKTAPFRVYSSIKESINDYINFLSTSDRYQQALQHNDNPAHFLHELAKAGYATDPNYADKILGTLSKVTSLLNQ